MIVSHQLHALFIDGILYAATALASALDCGCLSWFQLPCSFFGLESLWHNLELNWIEDPLGALLFSALLDMVVYDK